MLRVRHLNGRGDEDLTSIRRTQKRPAGSRCPRRPTARAAEAARRNHHGEARHRRFRVLVVGVSLESLWNFVGVRPPLSRQANPQRSARLRKPPEIISRPDHDVYLHVCKHRTTSVGFRLGFGSVSVGAVCFGARMTTHAQSKSLSRRQLHQRGSHTAGGSCLILEQAHASEGEIV